jgi:hypothetical protein
LRKDLDLLHENGIEIGIELRKYTVTRCNCSMARYLAAVESKELGEDG